MTEKITVRVADFVQRELTDLKMNLHAAGAKASKDDIAAALIHAGAASPIWVVRAAVEAYWAEEATEGPESEDGGG